MHAERVSGKLLAACRPSDNEMECPDEQTRIMLKERKTQSEKGPDLSGASQAVTSPAKAYKALCGLP